MTATDSNAEPDQDEQIRQIVDGWFPLTAEQLEKLSLLLSPGRGRHDAA
jgi:hypothetical protein